MMTFGFMKEDYSQEEVKSLHKVASVYEGLERIKLNKKRPALLQAFYLKIFRQYYSTEIIFLVAV